MSNAAKKANSLLSPITIPGAEQHQLDAIGAAVDNLCEPVRRGSMTIRQALELAAKEGFRQGSRG